MPKKLKPTTTEPSPLDELARANAELKQRLAERTIFGVCSPNDIATARRRRAAVTGEAIDFPALAALVGETDRGELDSIVLEYLASAETTFLKARDAFVRRDTVELAEASHAGKGSALNVCAGPLAAAWRALEDAALATNLDRALYRLNELESRFDELKTTFVESGR